jgi:hypothetical protein
MQQATEVLRLEKETAEKLAAKAFAKSYLTDLVPSVFNNLKENGYFYDPVERDIESGFLPWLIEQSLADLDKAVLGRNMLDSIIRHIVASREEAFEKLEQYLLVQGQNQEEQILESNVPPTIENSDQPTLDSNIQGEPTEASNLPEDLNDDEVNYTTNFNLITI